MDQRRVRRPLMAANWKMNKLVWEAEDYMTRLLPQISDADEVDVAVFAPFTCLGTVARMVQETSVMAGAQNFYYQDSGAFTGEISAPMLEDIGAGAVIIGHSERRALFGETDEMVARKTARAVSAKLLPVVCVGETKEERDAGRMWDKVSEQVRAVFDFLDANRIVGDDLVFAYEPVWAIGTGDVASPADAQETIGCMRVLLGELIGEDFAGQVRILYGGSIKPGNVGEILAQKDVDGGLVGGASLGAESFAEMVNGAEAVVE